MKFYKILPFMLCALLLIQSFAFAAHTEKSQGFTLTIPDDVYPLLKIKTSGNPNNIFNVSELGSVKAAKKLGQKYDGVGFLFSISKISKNKLHNMLQGDASGRELFATDNNGNYYIYNHPTDVRYVRENNDLMRKDQPIWNKVNDWAYTKVRQKFVEDNRLIPLTADNSEVGIAIAKVLYDKKAKYTLAATSAGTLSPNGVDPEKYLRALLYDAQFYYTHDPVPDGEYIGLYFPEEKTMYKFHCGKNNYITKESEKFPPNVYKGKCQNTKNAVTNIARWYQALAEKAGKTVTVNGDSYVGSYHESIAGRGHIDIVKQGNVYKINIGWGESAIAKSFWQMTGKFKNGVLTYNDCEFKSVEFNEKGKGKVKRSYKNDKGRFILLTNGDLIWEDHKANVAEDSVFVRD